MHAAYELVIPKVAHSHPVHSDLVPFVEAISVLSYTQRYMVACRTTKHRFVSLVS